MTASRSVINRRLSSRSVIHKVVIATVLRHPIGSSHRVIATVLRHPIGSSAPRSSQLCCVIPSGHPLRGHRNCVASSRRVITFGVIGFAVYLQYVQLLIPKESSPNSPNPLRFRLHAWAIVFHWRIVYLLRK